MRPALEQLARTLADAWRRGTTIPLPHADASVASRADAYAVQDRMAELIGERCIGWKVGAAVKAVQVLEGHDGPIVGRMFAPGLYTSPASTPASLYDGYKIECEFAFRFRQAVAARAQPYTRYDLAPRIELHPGLELAGCRYQREGAARRFTTHDAISDNGGGGAYVVSQEAYPDWGGIDFERLPIEARIDGGPPIEIYQGELRRDPVDILVETVNGLAERGIGFASGDLLSTGSLSVPTPLRKGQTYVARFGNLATLSVTMK